MAQSGHSEPAAAGASQKARTKCCDTSRARWRAELLALAVPRWHRRQVAWLPWALCAPARAVTLQEMSKGILGGDRDVYYPAWFQGDWEATTELVSVDFPLGEALADKEAVRQRQLLGTQQVRSLELRLTPTSGGGAISTALHRVRRTDLPLRVNG